MSPLSERSSTAAFMHSQNDSPDPACLGHEGGNLRLKEEEEPRRSLSKRRDSVLPGGRFISYLFGRVRTSERIMSCSTNQRQIVLSSETDQHVCTCGSCICRKLLGLAPSGRVIINHPHGPCVQRLSTDYNRFKGDLMCFF